MRRPRKERCRKSSRYPRGVKYVGSIEVRGRQKWVGSFPTAEEWREAAAVVEAELRGEAATETEVPPMDTSANGAEAAGSVPAPSPPNGAMTVADFLGVIVTDQGRVEPDPDPSVSQWPANHRRGITKESSIRVLRENVRPFAREHGHRPVDSFSRTEARKIAAGLTNGQKAAVRRLFTDLLDDELIERNHFERLSVKQVSRLESEGFRLVTDEEFSRLLDSALRSREDAYGRVVRAIVLLEGTIGVRPSEIFGVERELIDFSAGQIQLRHQIDDRGAIVPLKNSQQRLVPLTDELAEAILAAPAISDRWAFPAPRGRPFTISAWDRYWNPVRVSAGLPDLQFYELKHRAITRMCTPRPDGLGLDHADVALIVGHTDGGATIAKHYLKLDQQRAIGRFRQAAADGTSSGT